MWHVPGGAELCLEEGEAHPDAGAGALPEREERQPEERDWLGVKLLREFTPL